MRLIVVSLCVAALALVGCKHHPRNNILPPSQMLAEPGPGVGGPGPGVMAYRPAGPMVPPYVQQASQIAFVGPDGMQVRWDVSAPGMFDSDPLIAPGRQNFPQGAIYRLKLSDIPNRPGIDLYPTLEVAPVMPRTEAFLAHNPIPVHFTEEDLDQIMQGNFVTKVIYLPDPQFQELAIAGVETLVSTRLDPGVDPIVEADRRGSILAIVRIGNIDLRTPATEVREGEVRAAAYHVGAHRAGTTDSVPCPAGAAGAPGMPPGAGMCPPGGPMAPGMYPIGGPLPMAVHGGGAAPTPYVAGVTSPQYGMPMSGTPIGLAGPPHIPLGTPAGLQQHRIVNHTRRHIPEPTQRFRVDVKQTPGLSYPKPANHVKIVENNQKGTGLFTQPWWDKLHLRGSPGTADPATQMGGGCPTGGCPTGVCPTDAPCPQG